MKRFELKLRSHKSTRLSALKNCRLPATYCLLLLACLLLFGCQSRQPEASADALTAPLPTPPAPSPRPQPSIDPRVTDLERVKEGAPAPDFALADTGGKLYRLSDYKGKKHVVLVFYRGYF